MTTESPRGAGSCSPGRSDEHCTPFPDTLFRESSVELENAEPFANSREEIASLAALEGGDPGEIGSLPHSVLWLELATQDGEIGAGLPWHSSLELPEPHSRLAMQALRIKEEVEDEEVVIIADPRDAATVSPSGSLRATADDVVRPMEGLEVAGPAPFLRKTYEMVSDPGTDPVVSWGSSQESFVVWDQQEFSKQVLPRYFKHANFSSFIRQLNTYGFRKIDPDRWEFANQGFQKGKKQLLKNIKRRRKFSEHRKTSSSSTIPSDYQRAKKEVELETLKEEQEALKAKILELKEEREKMQHKINHVAERVHNAERINQQIFLFLTGAAKRPNFVQHLTPKRRQKREAEETCESSKKSKLLGPDGETTEFLLEVMDQKIQGPNLDSLRINDDSARIESGPNKVLETVQMDNLSPPPMGGGDFRDVPGQTPSEMAGASMSDWPSVFHDMSEKLLGDNLVFGEDTEEDVEVGLTRDDTGYFLELEGLIDKSYGWREHTK